MSFQLEEDLDETATPPRGTQAGLVLGLWLSGVFAASLGGRIEAGHEGWTSMVLLGVAVLWPLLYFAMGRCDFVPRSMPLAATGGLIVFGMAAALSSFMSPVALLSTSYVVLTLAGIFLALQFNSNLDAAQFEWGLKVFALLTTGLLVGFAWYDYVPGIRLGNGKDMLNPNTIGLVSVSVILAAMSIKTLALRLVVMGPIAGIIVLTSSRAAAVAAVVGLAMIVWLRLRARRRHRIADCRDRPYIDCRRDDRVWRHDVQHVGSFLWAEQSRSWVRLRGDGAGGSLEVDVGAICTQSRARSGVPRP